jgi:hypothetical protein
MIVGAESRNSVRCAIRKVGTVKGILQRLSGFTGQEFKSVSHGGHSGRISELPFAGEGVKRNHFET